ncbi:hypothetical protein Bbelb_331830 [Branchiostoma belcheri]|nr:hypothetical protein Bbelb_331830 [Branchiostoma belcheri]
MAGLHPTIATLTLVVMAFSTKDRAGVKPQLWRGYIYHSYTNTCYDSVQHQGQSRCQTTVMAGLHPTIATLTLVVMAFSTKDRAGVKPHFPTLLAYVSEEQKKTGETLEVKATVIHLYYCGPGESQHSDLVPRGTMEESKHDALQVKIRQLCSCEPRTLAVSRGGRRQTAKPDYITFRWPDPQRLDGQHL